MPITISSELEAKLRERARAEGVPIETYLESLIREDEWDEVIERTTIESDGEYYETRAAIEEGLAQAERGEAFPARAVFAGLRAKHGIPR